jgi:hypothetical protein
MNLDFFSPILSIIGLIQYAYRFTGAGKEIKIYACIIANTSSLLSHVILNLEPRVDDFSHARKRWIDAQNKCAETALREAKNVMEDRMNRSAGRRRLRDLGWVLKSKEEAQTCKEAVLQCHQTLLEIKMELALLEGMRSWCGDTFSPPDMHLYSQPRPIESADGARERLGWPKGLMSSVWLQNRALRG